MQAVDPRQAPHPAVTRAYSGHDAAIEEANRL
jgi:hypothetical protein